MYQSIDDIMERYYAQVDARNAKDEINLIVSRNLIVTIDDE